MNRKQSTTDKAEDVPSTFGQTKPPSGSADSEIIQVRILAPKDVGDKIAEAMQPLGLSVSGTQPEEGYENRQRTYLVIPVKTFRQRNGLVMASVIPTLEKPTPPTQARELLQKREKELQYISTKAANDSKVALEGTDPDALTKAKQLESATGAMLNLIRNGLDEWTRFDKQLADFNEATKKVNSIRPWIENPPECVQGHQMKFGGIRNWRGLGFNGDGWVTDPKADFRMKFDCLKCWSQSLLSLGELERLAATPKPKGNTKKLARWEGHEQVVSRGATK